MRFYRILFMTKTRGYDVIGVNVSPQIKENTEQLPNNSVLTTLLNEHTKVYQNTFSWLTLV